MLIYSRIQNRESLEEKVRQFVSILSKPITSTDAFSTSSPSAEPDDKDGSTAKKRIDAMEGLMRLYVLTHFDKEFEMLDDDWRMVREYEGAEQGGMGGDD